MSTTQEEILTTVDDDEPMEKSAKNNENEKKNDGHVKTSNSDSDYNEDKSVKVAKKGGKKTLPKFHSTMIA
jgi:hypothetical protein